MSYRSGEIMRWRVVRPNLANGVIVDPLPVNLQELVSFLQLGPAGVGRAKSVRFEAAVPSEFKPTFEVRWYGLPLRKKSSPRLAFHCLLENPWFFDGFPETARPSYTEAKWEA